MKPITLHPSSLLVGVALTGLAFFTMAQTPQPINPSLTRPSSPSLIRAQDMVRITEGTPYVVPPNKWLVITALGDKTYETYCNVGNNLNFLKVNGVTELSTLREDVIPLAFGYDCNMRSIPRGFSIPAGSVVEVGNTASVFCPPSPSNAEAWG